MLTGYVMEKYSAMTGAYTCNRLVEEAAKRGIQLKIIGAADLSVTGQGVFHKGQPLPQCDFLIHRYKPGRLKEAAAALAKICYNDTRAFGDYINKFVQVKNLHSEGFYMPEYLLGNGYTDFHQVTAVLGLPFVAKGLESAQGAEVYLIENAAGYEEMMRLYPKDKEYLFEEYIATSYGRDIRFYSVRGQVIACMTREAVSGFKANVALGAQVKVYPADENIRQAAKDIYEQTGLDFLGIDLLFGKDKPYFCEINVMPGIYGMEMASGVNVAAAIIDTIAGDFNYDI